LSPSLTIEYVNLIDEINNSQKSMDQDDELPF